MHNRWINFILLFISERSCHALNYFESNALTNSKIFTKEKNRVHLNEVQKNCISFPMVKNLWRAEQNHKPNRLFFRFAFQLNSVQYLLYFMSHSYKSKNKQHNRFRFYWYRSAIWFVFISFFSILFCRT